MYERPFEIVLTDEASFPQAHEQTRKVGGHTNGCRIGFDAGGSDRKVSAVVDGETVYSEEVVWHPKTCLLYTSLVELQTVCIGLKFYGRVLRDG